MEDPSPTISIIMFNINDLNTPIKGEIVRWDKKTEPVKALAFKPQ